MWVKVGEANTYAEILQKWAPTFIPQVCTSKLLELSKGSKRTDVS